MREIKFKVWDKENKCWYEPYDGINMRLEDGSLFDTCRYSDAWIDLENKNYIKVQYTGLKDKNGKEDYTGNIWEVEYEGKKIRYYRINYLDWDGYKFYFEPINHNVSPIHCEVYAKGIIIGNIYENPELLKD
jgi:hypothetical protein